MDCLGGNGVEGHGRGWWRRRGGGGGGNPGRGQGHARPPAHHHPHAPLTHPPTPSNRLLVDCVLLEGPGGTGSGPPSCFALGSIGPQACAPPSGAAGVA